VKLALKVDVATLRGAREGVPALVDMLERNGAGATFFVSLGPDHTARWTGSIKSERYARSLLYGRLFPAPQIGRRARNVLQSLRKAGFATGVLCHDAAGWQRHARDANAAWTAAELQRAIDRYADVFGEPPRAHGACGWQTNRHALRLMQRLGFGYCSDGRGRGPHLPVWNGELVRCPQFPTTLPTLDELARARAEDADALAARLLERTADAVQDHVFTLRADVEGIALRAPFEQLLLGWKAQGYELVALEALVESTEPLALPRCEVGFASVEGRSGAVFAQGGEFLADVELPRAA
jgi:peptidoglycan/xylan/chitin deacetylase (PgdA/CDA1 family)